MSSEWIEKPFRKKNYPKNQINSKHQSEIRNRYRNELKKSYGGHLKLIQNYNYIIESIFASKSLNNAEVPTPIPGVRIRSINLSATSPCYTLSYIRFCSRKRQFMKNTIIKENVEKNH